MKLNQLKHKKILILGFGREGLSTLKWLRRSLGLVKIGVADEKKLSEFDEKYRKVIERDKNLELYLGRDYLKELDKFEVIVKTPGLKLEDKLSIDYDFGSSLIQVRKLIPIKNVGIEDLIIERETTTWDWSNTIEYNYAAKCWILGVESFFTYKHHVDIHNSTFIEIRGSYFHHAAELGNGGEGYGIIIENHSTNCLVEDNLFDGLRHSMLVQSGANRMFLAIITRGIENGNLEQLLQVQVQQI